MRTAKFFLLSALAVASLNVSAGSDDFAQIQAEDIEYVNTNINSDGKVIHGGFITNPWYSNWSVTLMGGAQTIVSGTEEHNTGFDTHTAIITPSLELNLGKWFTPAVGMRVGFQGFWLEEYFKLPGDLMKYNHYMPKHDPVDESKDHVYYTQTYLHGDLMWNIINSFWGYKPNRFYNVIPYVQFGYTRLCHPDHPLFSTEYRDRELELGFGINNTFRISNAFQAVLDLRWGNLDGRYHDVRDGERVNHFTLQAGIAYNIERWSFARAKVIEDQRDVARTDAVVAMTALNDLVAENALLKNEVDGLKDEVEKAKAAPAAETLPRDEFMRRIQEAEFIVYYEINISKLNITEGNRLDEYVKSTLAANPEHIFYLTGSADEGTGNVEINTRLSHDRAEGVKALLMTKYNVPENQVVIKKTIISSEHADGSLDRCVLLENK